MNYNFSRGIPDWLGLPLAKESPFMEPLNIVLYKLKQLGAIEKIWKKYQPQIDKQCEEPKVSKYEDIYQQMPGICPAACDHGIQTVF